MDDHSTITPGCIAVPINFKAQLNPQQYAAVAADPGPVLVLAGAGAGKTRTLTYRVAWLLAQGIKPWEILLLTFTNKAAREMLERVERLTGVQRTHFWGGTFHSIGQRLIRRYGKALGWEPDFTIIDEKDAEALIANVIRAHDPDWLKPKTARPTARVTISILSYARNTRQSVHEALRGKYPFWLELSEPLTEILDDYQQTKRDQCVVDYDDLLDYWRQLLAQKPENVEHLHHRFQHILVDEYQDTNKLQAEIVDRIAPHHRIMAVGDDAQCIYTWRGADYENILTFPDRHPGTQVYKIETNYRSTPEILNFANAILNHRSSEAPSRYLKQLQPIRNSRQPPYLISSSDTRRQATFITQRIRSLVDQDHRRLSDVAVLYRAHHQSLDLQMELSRQSIPFIITSRVKFFDQAHIKDLIAQLRFVYNSYDSAAFNRFIGLLPRIGPKTAHRLLSLAQREAAEAKTSIIQALCRPQFSDKVNAEARESFIQLARTLGQIEEALWGSSPPTVTQANPSSSLRSQSSSISTPSSIVEIAIEGWYGDYLRCLYPNWESRRDDLNSLIGFAARYETLPDLLVQLVLLNSETSDRSIDPPQDCVRLTTIHQAKGLEYPIVFLIGLADGMLPLKRAIEEGDVEEERRLFYVAVTRAKDELYLGYPIINTASGPPITLSPSRFLRTIPKDCYEPLYVRSQLRE